MKDLTIGKPIKVILRFAIPLMLSAMLQQLYNFVDGKIVSKYVGSEAFGAIGATLIITNMLISFVNGLTQGFAIPVANSFGAKDLDNVRKNVAGTIKLITLFTVVLSVLAQIFIDDILIILHFPEEMMTDALNYVRIILFGIVFIVLYNTCANLLRSVGDSVTPLICLLGSVIINIGLDYLFVKIFNLGIQGAAYATLISQFFCGAACLIYLLVKYKELLPRKESWKLGRGQMENLLSTGVAMGLMGCIVNMGSVVLQGAIDKLGPNYVTAHTASRRVFELLTVMLFSISMSMTTYVSQNIGAGKYDRVRTGIKQVLILLTGISTVLIAVCHALSRPILQWIASTDNPAIIDNSVMYVKISICFFYVLGPLLVLRMSLQGMGRKIIPIITSIMEMVIKIFSAYLLVPRFGYKGVAFTEPISWVLMAIVLAIAYLSDLPEKKLPENQEASIM